MVRVLPFSINIKTVAITLFLVCANLQLISIATAAEILGPVKVVDGDTIDINGARVHFFGVDAPEIDQKCVIYQLEWPCGKRSIVILERLIGAQPVRCEIIDMPKGSSVTSPVNARCFNFENLELNAAIIGEGMALPLLRETKRYMASEKHAQLKRIGMWSGRFIAPADWRDGKRFKRLGKTVNRNKLKD